MSEDKSPRSEMGRAFREMKKMDPGSVVRESEVKKSAARKMKIKNQAREVMKSRRTRRRAREIFTELKATGKIPKGMKFEELSDKKFFEAAKDIKDVELKRRLIQISRDQQEKMLKSKSEKKRKKMFGR